MTINIYISRQTEDLLTDIRKKYHVSLSTISQILSDYFKPNFKFLPNNFFTEYLDQNHRNKTTIKPNNAKDESDFFQAIKGELKTASHVYSNLLYLFAKKDIKYLLPQNIANEKQIEKCIKEIEKELLKKHEIYWNYNINLRNQTRIIRKNADYFRRILA